MILALYRMLTTSATPMIRLYLRGRKKRGKEDKERFHERLGLPKRKRPEGALAWLHAASVGESLSMLPLVERLLAEKDGLKVMVTTGTVTSAKLMAERLPEGAFHQYIPVDLLKYVRRFLDHWRPDLALWAESEFWPNLVSETANRNIPLVLINGRISPSSHMGWQRYKSLINKLLSGFTLCLGQTEEDAWRLLSLGAHRAKCLGNLKFAAPPLPADPLELKRLEAVLKDRRRWLAASTHPGEEEMFARACVKLKKKHPGLLGIIVPRHPQRGGEIAKALRGMGLNAAQRSSDEEVSENTDIYVADTMGELGLFFRLAGIVFMGKSLVPLGGQNPLEAALLDCAILHGPHIANFREIFSRLKEDGGAEEADGEADLALKAGKLLANKKDRDRMAKAAKDFAAAEAGILDAIMAELKPLLDQMGEPDERA